VVYGRITAPQDGATVTVTGTVEDALDVQAVEQKLGIDLDPQALQRLGLDKEDAVMIADSVQTAAGTATPPTSSPTPAGTITPATSS
jgi:hypothetical protein